MKKKPEATLVYFKKDNHLISSIGEMTIVQRKIFDGAITRVKLVKNDNGIPCLSSDISAQELTTFLGTKSDSIYTYIKEFFEPREGKKPGLESKKDKPNPRSLRNWNIYVKDDEKQKLVYHQIITDATYENGHLQIIWNNGLYNNLIELKGDYTMLNREITSKFKSVYAYQLYQILKQTLDKQKYLTKNDGPFEISIDLVDLKAQLGVININENNILREAVTDDSVVSFDAIEKIDDKEYLRKIRDYGDLNKKALIRGEKEINEKSDISIKYKPDKRGRGGKAVAVIFTVQYKEVPEEDDIVVENTAKQKDVDVLDFIDQMREFMGNEFTSNNLRAIAEAAEYDLQKIRNKHKIYSVQGSIKNPPGWMIDAIKNDYVQPNPFKDKNKFGNFEQRTIDFADLEKKLLDN